jgi:hypothetical protein
MSGMNKKQKEKFTIFVKNNKYRIVMNPFLKTREGRTLDEKRENYRVVVSYLIENTMNSREEDVGDAAKIIRDVLGLPLDIEKPPRDPAEDLPRLMADFERDSTNVGIERPGYVIKLDIDQNKHQPDPYPIGTRPHAGNRFIARDIQQNPVANAAWHQANTLVEMYNWARFLGQMSPGERETTHQAIARGEYLIHYEGYCLQGLNATRYVLFHCYPDDRSELKARGKKDK